MLAHIGIVSADQTVALATTEEQPVGMRESSQEHRVARARRLALDSIAEQARAGGANAILAVRVEYTSVRLSASHDVLLITVSGTAVRL